MSGPRNSPRIVGGTIELLEDEITVVHDDLDTVGAVTVLSVDLNIELNICELCCIWVSS